MHKFTLSLTCLIASISLNTQASSLEFSHLDGWAQANVTPVFAHYRAIVNKAAPELGNAPSNKAIKHWIEQNFEPIYIPSQSHETLVTGYHIYRAKASKTKTKAFPIPLYQNPKRQGHKHRYTHAQILDGALDHKALEIAWVQSPIDRYLLMMQGSGILEFPDGSLQSLVYAGENGHPYRSISTYMIKKAYITEAERNGPTIKAYLTKNTDRALAILKHNPSFVYFSLEPKAPSFSGAAGTPLKAKTSIAIDPKFYPQHGLFWLQTQRPTPTGNQHPWQGLVISQDTGGAIKGPQRADIFFGQDPDAEYLAGYMKDSQARLIYLKPKTKP